MAASSRIVGSRFEPPRSCAQGGAVPWRPAPAGMCHSTPSPGRASSVRPDQYVDPMGTGGFLARARRARRRHARRPRRRQRTLRRRRGADPGRSTRASTSSCSSTAASRSPRRRPTATSCSSPVHAGSGDRRVCSDRSSAGQAAADGRRACWRCEPVERQVDPGAESCLDYLAVHPSGRCCCSSVALDRPAAADADRRRRRVRLVRHAMHTRSPACWPSWPRRRRRPTGGRRRARRYPLFARGAGRHRLFGASRRQYRSPVPFTTGCRRLGLVTCRARVRFVVRCSTSLPLRAFGP